MKCVFFFIFANHFLPSWNLWLFELRSYVWTLWIYVTDIRTFWITYYCVEDELGSDVFYPDERSPLTVVFDQYFLVPFRSYSIQPTCENLLFQVQLKSQNRRLTDWKIKSVRFFEFSAFDSNRKRGASLRKIQRPKGNLFGEGFAHINLLESEWFADENGAGRIELNIIGFGYKFEGSAKDGFLIFELKWGQQVLFYRSRF